MKDDDHDEKDEKKLLYVGMTRAREVLYLLYSEEINYIPNLVNTEKEYDKMSDWLKQTVEKNKKVVIR